MKLYILFIYSSGPLKMVTNGVLYKFNFFLIPSFIPSLKYPPSSPFTV